MPHKDVGALKLAKIAPLGKKLILEEEISSFPLKGDIRRRELLRSVLDAAIDINVTPGEKAVAALRAVSPAVRLTAGTMLLRRQHDKGQQKFRFAAPGHLTMCTPLVEETVDATTGSVGLRLIPQLQMKIFKARTYNWDSRGANQVAGTIRRFIDLLGSLDVTEGRIVSWIFISRTNPAYGTSSEVRAEMRISRKNKITDQGEVLIDLTLSGPDWEVFDDDSWHAIDCASEFRRNGIAIDRLTVPRWFSDAIVFGKVVRFLGHSGLPYRHLHFAEPQPSKPIKASHEPRQDTLSDSRCVQAFSSDPPPGMQTPTALVEENEHGERVPVIHLNPKWNIFRNCKRLGTQSVCIHGTVIPPSSFSDSARPPERGKRPTIFTLWGPMVVKIDNSAFERSNWAEIKFVDVGNQCGQRIRIGSEFAAFMPHLVKVDLTDFVADSPKGVTFGEDAFLQCLSLRSFTIAAKSGVPVLVQDGNVPRASFGGGSLEGCTQLQAVDLSGAGPLSRVLARSSKGTPLRLANKLKSLSVSEIPGDGFSRGDTAEVRAMIDVARGSSLLESITVWPIDKDSNWTLGATPWVVPRLRFPSEGRGRREQHLDNEWWAATNGAPSVLCTELFASSRLCTGYPSMTLGSITISGLSEVTSIGDECFASLPRLRSMELVDLHKLRTIGRGFGRDCGQLESFTLRNLPALQQIGRDFAKRCGKLTELHFDGDLSQLVRIGSRFAEGCNALRQLDLSHCTALMRIDAYFCAGCVSLGKLVMPWGPGDVDLATEGEGRPSPRPIVHREGYLEGVSLVHNLTK